jgi:hypothetical protein
MIVKELITYITGVGRGQNVFIVAPDRLGLTDLVVDELRKVFSFSDVVSNPAPRGLGAKDWVRSIEQDAHKAPRGGGERTHYFMYGMGSLPVECVGPMLKVLEESRYSRFILQSSVSCPKLSTLQSRCMTCRIPFYSRREVGGVLKCVARLDIEPMDEFDLYDGTIEGTTQALLERDDFLSVRKELTGRGSLALMSDDFCQSDREGNPPVKYTQFVEPRLTREEREYATLPTRRRLAGFRLSRRGR